MNPYVKDHPNRPSGTVRNDCHHKGAMAAAARAFTAIGKPNEDALFLECVVGFYGDPED